MASKVASPTVAVPALKDTPVADPKPKETPAPAAPTPAPAPPANNNANDNAPAKENTPAKDNAPAKDNTPAKDNAPAKDNTPPKDNNPPPTQPNNTKDNQNANNAKDNTNANNANNNNLPKATNAANPTTPEVVTTLFTSESATFLPTLASSSSTETATGEALENSSESSSGGMSAGAMIGGMFVATLAIVALITFIVRRKINVLKSSRFNARRQSHKLRDNDFNDIYVTGQPTYYDEKHGYNTRGSIVVNEPDQAVLRADGMNYSHEAANNNQSGFTGHRQSIFRQSTGSMYAPPPSLMPVNGRFTPPLARQNSLSPYPNMGSPTYGEYDYSRPPSRNEAVLQRQEANYSIQRTPSRNDTVLQMQEANYDAGNYPVQRSPTRSNESAYASRNAPPGH